MRWSLSEDADFLLLVPKSATLGKAFGELEAKPQPEGSSPIDTSKVSNPHESEGKQIENASEDLDSAHGEEVTGTTKRNGNERLVGTTPIPLFEKERRAPSVSLNFDDATVKKALETLKNCTRDHCYVGEDVKAYLIVTPTPAGGEKENNRKEFVAKTGFPSKLSPWFQFFSNLYCHLEIPNSQAETVSVVRACAKNMEILDHAVLNSHTIGEDVDVDVDMVDALKVLISCRCIVYCFGFQVPNEISNMEVGSLSSPFGHFEHVQVDMLCMRPADSSNFGSDSVSKQDINNVDTPRFRRYDHRYEVAGCDFPSYDPMILSFYRKDPALSCLEGLNANPYALMPRTNLLNDPHCTIRMSHKFSVTKVFHVESKSYFIANRCMILVSVENITRNETIDIQDIALIDGLESCFAADLMGGVQYPLILQPLEQYNFVFCIKKRTCNLENSPIRIHNELFRSRIEMRWRSDVFYPMQRSYHFVNWSWTGKLDIPLSINLVGEGLNSYPVGKAFNLILEILNKGDDEVDLDLIMPTNTDQMTTNNAKRIPTCICLNVTLYVGLLKPKATVRAPLRFIGLQNGTHQVINKIILRDRSSANMYDMSSQCLLEVNINSG